MAECGRGWAKRCASSKGKKCRCRCGGENHGGALKLDATAQEVVDFAARHARYRVVSDLPKAIIIRDLGPWDRVPTVTNDAEYVVAEIAHLLINPPRRLYYYDSDNDMSELVVKDGKFAGFAPLAEPSFALAQAGAA